MSTATRHRGSGRRCTASRPGVGAAGPGGTRCAILRSPPGCPAARRRTPRRRARDSSASGSATPPSPRSTSQRYEVTATPVRSRRSCASRSSRAGSRAASRSAHPSSASLRATARPIVRGAPRTNAVSVTSFIAPFSCCSPVPWRRSRPAEPLPRQAPGMDWPADGGNGYWRSPVGDVGGHGAVRLRPLPQRQPTTSPGSMKRAGTGAETGARAACSGLEQRHPPLAAREEVAGTLVQAVGE